MQMTTKRTEGRIKSDFGMTDYYKYYKSKVKDPVDNHKFHKVISEFNSKIVDLIINEGLEFTPVGLHFNFCVRKTKRIARIKDNKLINTAPIDWKATKDLWENDSAAKDNKILLRFLNNHTSKHIFRIRATKVGQKYRNKKLYRFKACRSFQRLLAKRILDKNQDNFNSYDLW